MQDMTPPPTRRRFWVAGCLALVALGWMLAVVVVNAVAAADRRRAAEAAYVHTLDVLLVTGALSTSANAALRGERGYLLTRDESFLEPYRAARLDMPRLAARLRRLTADNPRQRAPLADLGVRLDSYARVLAATIDLARRGRGRQAQAVVRAGVGRDRIEGVLRVVRVLEAEERRLLRRRSAENAAATRRAERYNAVLAVLAAALLLVSAAAGLAAFRAHRRLQAATDLLERVATTDVLTDLPNRRAFMAALRTEIVRAGRSGEPLGLAILDIDHFKRVNDRHGHPAGDAVLAAAAEKMRAAVRAGDVVGRIGGEEFAILMPSTDTAGATLVCERLRAAIEARPVDVAGAIGIAVTVSTGIALLSPGERCDDLIARADKALYAAKTGGRNQVRLAA